MTTRPADPRFVVNGINLDALTDSELRAHQSQAEHAEPRDWETVEMAAVILRGRRDVALLAAAGWDEDRAFGSRGIGGHPWGEDSDAPDMNWRD